MSYSVKQNIFLDWHRTSETVKQVALWVLPGFNTTLRFDGASEGAVFPQAGFLVLASYH